MVCLIKPQFEAGREQVGKKGVVRDRKVHEEVIENRYYLPMSWLPHITLAKTLDDEQMKLAFEYMQKHFVSIKSKVERVGLAKTNPHQEIMDIKL